MAPQGKRKTRRYSYRRKRSNNMHGGKDSVAPPNHIMSRYLLIVPNAEHAILYAGANLLAAPGWCVVCDTGEKSIFYKTMSRLGVYDYYYGFDSPLEDGSGTVMDVFPTLAWCAVYTTSQKIRDTYNPVFDYKIKLLDTTPSKEMLNQKLNRRKTIEIQQIEKQFKENGYELAVPTAVANAEIAEEMRDIPAELEKGGEQVVVMNETNFTLSNILDCIQLGLTIAYLPSTSSAPILSRLRGNIDSNGADIETRKRIDLYFATTPFKVKDPSSTRKYTAAFRYQYEIDLNEPIIIRSHNYVIKKLFTTLETIEELKTVFFTGFQFLSRLRMMELEPVKVSTDAQKGGQYNEDFDEYMDDNDDGLDFLYGKRTYVLPMTGGSGQRRRKFSYRRRARDSAKKLKGSRRRLSFRNRFRDRK